MAFTREAHSRSPLERLAREWKLRELLKLPELLQLLKLLWRQSKLRLLKLPKLLWRWKVLRLLRSLFSPFRMAFSMSGLWQAIFDSEIR